MPWGRFLIVLIVIGALGAVLWLVVFAEPSPTAPGATTSLTSVPTPASPSSAAPADAREHRWLGRPLDRTAVRDFADRTYLYGASKNNAYRVHHGLDMVNPTGTLVHAAAAGMVVFAGKDSGTRFGPSTIPNFYGNMVLIKLKSQYRNQDVYYLNGHLDIVQVTEGQQVNEGDVLGKVGMTGTADGPHLHFEVRVGGMTYANSRNPALWLRTLPGTGALVGKVTDAAGKPVAGVIVSVFKDITVSDVQKYWGETSTYTVDPLGKLNPDDDWGENIAITDLPVGQYELRVNLGSQTYMRRVTVRDGQTTWLTVQEGSAPE